MRLFTMLFWVVVFVAIAAISALNAVPVALNYYIGLITVPLPVVIVGFFLLGFLLASLFWSIRQIKCQYHLRQLKFQCKERSVQ
jgi:uncharacterized integral membrane protein